MLMPRFLKFLLILFVIFSIPFFYGFDYSRHSISLEDINEGGPGKDGIPALFKPKFVDAKFAGSLKSDDRVIGLVVDGVAKAYPIKILNWHEIVNDKIKGRSFSVTFCPLCGTGMVFDARANGRELTFGVSGLLYQSDMLMYDRQTESLWSQIKMEAVTGPLLGAKLKLIPSLQTTWKHWQQQHPDTVVLSDETGFRRNYQIDPYGSYYTSPDLMFDVAKQSRAFHPKEKVIGVEYGKVKKAYPFKELAREKNPVKDLVNGKKIIIHFDKQSQTAVVLNDKGKEEASVVGFWFAWYAFHPDTEIYSSGGSSE